MQDRDLMEAETREVGRRVREELARRRISRQALADMAKISLSTLEKALAGTRPFTLASTIRLEEALGTPLRPATAVAPPPAAPGLAPESMGAYARAAVRWLEGRYLTLRPSFGNAGGIYSYVITIRWLDEAGHLGFAESQRIDAQFEQGGHVSLSTLSGHIYLVTNESGQHRLMVLSRPTIAGTLYGVLTTLQVGNGSQLVPVACPVALRKLAADAEPATGLIAPGAPEHQEYRATLQTATRQDFARFYAEAI
jgi:transcriptional regulator with XRE-family HTH domain